MITIDAKALKSLIKEAIREVQSEDVREAALVPTMTTSNVAIGQLATQVIEPEVVEDAVKIVSETTGHLHFNDGVKKEEPVTFDEADSEPFDTSDMSYEEYMKEVKKTIKGLKVDNAKAKAVDVLKKYDCAAFSELDPKDYSAVLEDIKNVA